MVKRLTETKSDTLKPEEPQPDRFTAYLDLGRKNQKLRTRDALVTVAADLICKGQAVSVTEVADTARVSRTTAYRYFPTSEMLAAQATLKAANTSESQELDAISVGPGSPQEKLDAIISGSHAITLAHETAFRSLLRFTVEAGTKVGRDLPRRPAFRRMWVEGCLAPLKKDLGARRFNRLTGALCLLCGIEPVVVLSDICQMPQDEARELKRWAGQQLLRAAIEEAAAVRASRAKAKKTGKTAKPSRPGASASSQSAPERAPAPQARPRSSAKRV